MRVVLSLVALFAVAAFLPARAVFAGDEGNPPDVKAPPSRTDPWDEANRLVKQRRETIQRFLAVLAEDDVQHRKERELLAAIYLLGKYRAEESIESLSRCLDFEPKDYEAGNGVATMYEYFPAAVALVQIGQPAVQEMTRVICNPQKTELEREIASWVLLMIQGHLDRDVVNDLEEVKATVIQRLESLPGLNLQKRVLIERAVTFLYGYAGTDFGRRSQVPEVIDGPVLKTVNVGRPCKFTIRFRAPIDFPMAKVKLYLYGDGKLPDGLELNESGEIVGVPKSAGAYHFVVSAVAHFESDAALSPTVARKSVWIVVKHP